MIAHHPAPAVLREPRPTTRVYGPAYLDRVLLVDSPLRPGAVVDGSVDGESDPTTLGAQLRLVLAGPDGRTLTIATPDGWPGPFGRIRITGPDGPLDTRMARKVRGVTWHDDLGGMGAGYASALEGTLNSALGGGDDPTSRLVADLIAANGIVHHPWRVPERTADWTLLVSSGRHGDKLAVGFRGCHAALTPAAMAQTPVDAVDLLVVAGLPTAHSSAILDLTPSRTLRMLAPAMRTMRDRKPSIAALAGRVDLLTCNRAEWDAAGPSGRSHLRAATPLIAVTDGPAGARLLLGEVDFDVPAFPRTRPPRDTNRAGEAFASTLVTRLWRSGWRRGLPLDTEIARAAVLAATAAAALVLDLDRFGFPSEEAIQEALAQNRVE